MEELAPKLIVVLVTSLVALVLDTLVGKALRHVLDKTSLPSASIFVNIVRVIIWTLAVMSVLYPVFGIEPTGFVAALGVGSVALSLGLQTTISNIIGGLTITACKVVEPGDWITVSDVTGKVTDITWRHTVVTDILGSETVVPNSVMNSAQVVRLSGMAARKTTFTVEVAPGADLDQAVLEAQTLIRQSLRDAGYAWDETESLVLMNGATSFGAQMTAVLFVDDPTTVGLARDVASRAIGDCSWLASLPSVESCYVSDVKA